MTYFGINITSDNRDVLSLALHAAFLGTREDLKATHYISSPSKGLVFLWGGVPPDAISLPVPLSWQAAADIAWQWLQGAEYPDEPDHDGSNNKGFEVYNENNGWIGGHYCAIVGVRPWWAMYGK